MERLTQRDSDGCAYVIHKYTRLYGEFVDRLAKYEDTWLMPETIEKLLDTNKSLIEQLVSYRKAESQGLLHKAPVPNGTPIYFIRYDDWLEDDGVHSIEYIYGLTENLYGEINKDWYLTEEEAKKKFEQIKDRF